MQYLDPDYRKTFIFKVCAGGLLVIAAGGFGLFCYLDRPFAGGYLEAVSILDELRRDVFLGVLVAIVVQLSLFILLVFGASLFWTHKIAGPLHRFKSHCRWIAAGDLAPMADLRSGDQLQQIPSLLNDGLAAYQEKAVQTARKLRSAIDELETQLQSWQSKGMIGADRLRQLEKRLQEMSAINEQDYE